MNDKYIVYAYDDVFLLKQICMSGLHWAVKKRNLRVA